MSDEDRTSSNEASPLLGSRPGHRRFASVASLKSIHVPQAHDKTTIVNLLCLIVLLASSAGGFLQIPQARLIEDVLCHEYYDRAQSLEVPIDEKLCKVESIQSELAYILAITSALSAGLGLVATFPWSLVADRYGLTSKTRSGLKLMRTLGLGANRWFLCVLRVKPLLFSSLELHVLTA